MAGPQAAEEPSPEQMIREMQSAGFHPGGEAPQPTELSEDQMIKEMQAGGYHPQVGFLAEHGLEGAAHGLIDALPAGGAIIGGGLGGMAGGIGSIPGAGIGAVTGTAAKEILNRWVFGDQAKPLGAQVRENVIEADKAMLSQKAGELIGKGISKVAEHFVPPSAIARYKDAADVVMKLKDDTDGNVAQAADQVKEGLQTSLDEFRGNMNSQISAALKDSRATVDTKDVLEALSEAKANLHPTVDAADAAKLTEVEQMIKQLDGYPEAGKMTVQDANALKQKLQDLATSAYRNPGETSGGSKFAEAAKKVAAEVRTSINEAAPELKAVNDKLADLHELEDGMNKSLIRTGRTESPLLAAGKYTPGREGGSARNFEALRKLGEITGQDFVSPAQDLAAMQTLGNAKPSLSPTGNIPFAIKQGVNFSKTGAGKTLGQALPQIGGQVGTHVGLTLVDMYGNGAMNSLQDMSKQNGF